MAELVGAELTSDGPHAFVPLIVTGAVAIVDTKTHTWKSATADEVNPYGVAAIPHSQKVYVTQSGTNLVGVMNASTGKAIGDGIVVGVYPHGIALSPGGDRAFVANTGPDTGPGGSDTVSVIDTSSDKVTGMFTVGQAPQMIAVGPNGRRAYVTCSQGVYAIDARHGHGRGRRLGSACAGAHGLAVSPDGTQLYVADAERDQLVVLDAASGKVIRRVAVGRMPWGVALTSDGAAVYVTNANSDTVSVYDVEKRRITSTLHVPRIPTGISAFGGEMWVAGNVSSTISVIDTKRRAVTHRIEFGVSAVPTTIAFA
jgi:phospholipase C